MKNTVFAYICLLCGNLGIFSTILEPFVFPFVIDLFMLFASFFLLEC